MIFGQNNLFDFPGTSFGKKATHIILAPTVKKDVSLEALLEEPIEKKPPRNPLEWVGASFMHVLILAALIIIPLYTTGTIHLGEYKDIPLVAPPPPPPPAAVAAAAPAVSHAPLPHAVVFHTHKLVAPVSIPNKISQEQADGAAPSLSGVIGGVPGGVAGGQLGGSENGVPGAAGNAPPPPPPVAKPVQQKRIVRAGSNLKPPRKTFSVNPEYSSLARQAHIAGVVIVDAIIDEQGNVVQAHALSGPPLLIPPALKAVLQWKYEPTVLNGQPVSVELEVQVNFTPKG
jgi:outer membrane biosynthesis protein TonB